MTFWCPIAPQRALDANEARPGKSSPAPIAGGSPLNLSPGDDEAGVHSRRMMTRQVADQLAGNVIRRIEGLTEMPRGASFLARASGVRREPGMLRPMNAWPPRYASDGLRPR